MRYGQDRLHRSSGMAVWGKKGLGSLTLLSGAVALVVTGTVPAPASSQQVATTSLVFDGVSVIDVEHGKPLPAQRVVIAGNRIRAVGNADAVKIPKNARVVDARSKYLIPGLWDMHVHVSPLFKSRQYPGFHAAKGDTANPAAAYRAFYPLFLVYGVTGVREMVQAFPHSTDSFLVRQRAIAAGERLGPRAIGPLFNIQGLDPYGRESPLRTPEGPIFLETPDDVRRLVDSLKAAGVTFLKFNGAVKDKYFALLREARRVGLPFVGHIPFPMVSSIEAADSGQRSIEHADLYHPCWPTGAAEKCAPVAAAFIRNNTWLTPTLTIEKYWFPDELSKGQAVVRTLHDLGVTRFLAGSDFNYGDASYEVSPPAGRSLAEELVLLTESGLTSLEALQAATLNPAKFLDATDSLGTIAPGKLADLVLLDADPLSVISNVTRIRAVVANGRYLDRATLDSIAAAATRRVEALLND